MDLEKQLEENHKSQKDLLAVALALLARLRWTESALRWAKSKLRESRRSLQSA